MKEPQYIIITAFFITISLIIGTIIGYYNYLLTYNYLDGIQYFLIIFWIAAISGKLLDTIISNKLGDKVYEKIEYFFCMLILCIVFCSGAFLLGITTYKLISKTVIISYLQFIFVAIAFVCGGLLALYFFSEAVFEETDDTEN